MTSGTYTLTNITFSNNKAYSSGRWNSYTASMRSRGGAVYVNTGGLVTSSRINYVNNWAYLANGNSQSYAVGGGFYRSAGTSAFKSCNFTGNVVSGARVSEPVPESSLAYRL